MALPIALYSTAQVRALDAHAIQELGIPGYTLMKRAGEAALRYLRTRWPMAHRIVIVCGGGNNGGDGYVLGRFAQAAGLTVTLLAAVAPEDLKGDATTLHRSGQNWRVDTEEGPVDAKEAVVALGPWAPDLLGPLGIKLPLAFKRGYHRHYKSQGNAGLTRPMDASEGNDAGDLPSATGTSGGIRKPGARR